MTLDIALILSLVREIDREDTIEWGMLNIGEEEATMLLATSVVEHYENNIRPLAPDDRDYVVVAAIAKLTLENFILNVRLAKALAPDDPADDPAEKQ